MLIHWMVNAERMTNKGVWLYENLKNLPGSSFKASSQQHALTTYDTCSEKQQFYYIHFQDWYNLVSVPWLLLLFVYEKVGAMGIKWYVSANTELHTTQCVLHFTSANIQQSYSPNFYCALLQNMTIIGCVVDNKKILVSGELYLTHPHTGPLMSLQTRQVLCIQTTMSVIPRALHLTAALLNKQHKQQTPWGQQTAEKHQEVSKCLILMRFFGQLQVIYCM